MVYQRLPKERLPFTPKQFREIELSSSRFVTCDVTFTSSSKRGLR